MPLNTVYPLCYYKLSSFPPHYEWGRTKVKWETMSVSWTNLPLGWNIFEINRTVGGLFGYSSVNSIVSLNVPSSNGVSCGLYAEEGLQNRSQTGLHIPSTNSLVTVDITVEWSAYGNICAVIQVHWCWSLQSQSSTTVLIMELPCQLSPVKLFL